uniref:Uncharacterized protein n=1 Tax=Timema bartmani TaxID=61472 RepID=A0A7R9EQH4_9NEOP|nr:unnamed protein product [Timema bartmani]
MQFVCNRKTKFVSSQRCKTMSESSAATCYVSYVNYHPIAGHYDTVTQLIKLLTGVLDGQALKAVSDKDRVQKETQLIRNSPNRDSNLDLPVLGSLAQHDTSASDNYATEVGWCCPEP